MYTTFAVGDRVVWLNAPSKPRGTITRAISAAGPYVVKWDDFEDQGIVYRYGLRHLPALEQLAEAFDA